MKFVFDTSPLSTLFKNYYRRRFPTLWEKFDAILEEGRLISAREALREIEDGPVESLREWAANHEDLFTSPTAEEAKLVGRNLYRSALPTEHRAAENSERRENRRSVHCRPRSCRKLRHCHA